MKLVVYLTIVLVPLANESIGGVLYPVEIPLLLAILVFPVSRASRAIRFHTLDYLVLLYVVVNLISVGIGMDRLYESARHFRLHVVTPVAIYFVVRFGLSRIEEYEKALFLLIPLTAWQGLLLADYYVTHGHRPVDVEGAASTITLGVLFATTMFVCLYCRPRDEGAVSLVARWAVFLLLLGGLVVSSTRAAILGFLALSLFVSCFWNHRHGRRLVALGVHVLVWPLLVVVLSGAVIYSDAPQHEEKEARYSVGRVLDVSLYMSDIDRRIAFWSRIVGTSLANPVFGSGAADYSIGHRGAAGFHLGSSHNYLVSAVVTSGLLGLATVLLLIWKSYAVFVGRFEQHVAQQRVAKVLLTGLTVLMIAMLFNDLTGGRVFLWFFFLGLISKMHSDTREDSVTYRRLCRETPPRRGSLVPQARRVRL